MLSDAVLRTTGHVVADGLKEIARAIRAVAGKHCMRCEGKGTIEQDTNALIRDADKRYCPACGGKGY